MKVIPIKGEPTEEEEIPPPLITTEGLIRPEALHAWLLDLGAGERIADAAANPSKRTEAMVAAEKWAATDKWSLLLSGNVGVGKSCAAGRVLRHAVDRMGSYGPDGAVTWRRQFARARWVSAQGLAELGYREGWEGRLARLADVPWLVLDDLGREQHSDLWQARLDDLVNRRWCNRPRTIITANCSLATMKANYGERIFDRLRDGIVFELSGSSLRGGGHG